VVELSKPVKGSKLFVVTRNGDQIVMFNPDKIESINSHGADTVLVMDSGDRIAIFGIDPVGVCSWITNHRKAFAKEKKAGKKK
jgi:hypothetical protein